MAENQFIIPLRDKRAQSIPVVGGKAAGLATLIQAGYPVPPGICLTIEAFKLALRPFQPTLFSIIQTATLTPAQKATQINDLLQDLSLPSPIQVELFDLLPQIIDGETAVAVRSSSSDEDGTAASFAGQYATFLGLYGENAIVQAILNCWKSYFSANVFSYRQQTSRLDTNAGMAVLLQPLIDATCSGVAFSVDPVAQKKERIVVNSAWGLGVGIIDGTIANDTDWVNRTNWHIEKRHIVEKSAQIQPDNMGQIQKATIPQGYGRSACLPESWLTRIAQFAVTLEQLGGQPQDIEWTITNDQIWILQSRPLTGLPPTLKQTNPFPITWQENEQTHSWRRAHYKAHQQDVPLPLEYDQFEIMESVREEACRLIGVERHVAMQQFNGRPYYHNVPIAWTEADRRIRNQAFEDQRDRLFAEGYTLWEVWGPEVEKTTERLRVFDYATSDGQTLAEHLQEALAALRRGTIIHPLCTWRPRKAYYAAYTAVTGKSGSAAEAAAIQLLDGGDTPLTQLIDALYALGRTARSHPFLTSLLKEPPPNSCDVILQQLNRWDRDTAVTAFKQQFTELLAVYGERVGDGYGSEATIRTPTWRENPAHFLRLAAIYLDPNQADPAVLHAKTQQKRVQLVETICSACENAQAVENFKRLWRNGRRWWSVLEIHNHYIDQMAYGQLHHAIMASARWLVTQRCLPKAEDVFWLKFSEIDDALRHANPIDFTEKIKARKLQHTTWTALTAPAIVGIPDKQLPQRSPLTDDVTVHAKRNEPYTITGQGASSGQVTGIAYVATNAWEWPDVEAGAILVADNIGPHWTPLFPLLGGIVLDSGSVGQHAAVTAREYGVTAVIGTSNATQRIKNGDLLWVDGTNGIVKINNKSTTQRAMSTEES